MLTVVFGEFRQTDFDAESYPSRNVGFGVDGHEGVEVNDGINYVSAETGTGRVVHIEYIQGGVDRRPLDPNVGEIVAFGGHRETAAHVGCDGRTDAENL